MFKGKYLTTYLKSLELDLASFLIQIYPLLFHSHVLPISVNELNFITHLSRVPMMRI